MTERPDPRAPGSAADDSRAEQVLAQALRVMAGGERGPASPPAPPPSAWRRLTTGQLMLLAAIVGLLIGICAGFLSVVL